MARRNAIITTTNQPRKATQTSKNGRAGGGFVGKNIAATATIPQKPEVRR